MSKGIIPLSILENIAKAIRYANGLSTKYKPSEMENAIRGLKKSLGQKTITSNGTYSPSADNLDGYSEVTVTVEGGSVLVSKNIVQNGTYDPTDDNADGYSGVTVNVPPSVLVSKNITANGDYIPSDDNADGYSSVSVAVPGPSLQSKTATANGTVTPDSGYDGLSSVAVAVPNTYSAADNGKVVSSGQLVAQTSRAAAITENGTFDTTENNSVTVNVPNSYSAQDEGKVVSNGALVAQTMRTVTANGTYDTTSNNSVIVNVDASGTLANYDKWELLNTGSAGGTLTVYTNPQTDSLPYDSLSVLNLYTKQTSYLVKKVFCKLDNIVVEEGWLWSTTASDPHIHEKALTEAHIDGEDCEILGSDSPLFTRGSFEGFYNLEKVYLNTSAVIGECAFNDILDNQSRPSNLPLRIYMHGNTLGTCNDYAFGSNWQTNGSGGGSESESSSSGCSGCSGGGGGGGAYNIPNLEIYVPAALLNDFKTTWASGMFANNIFPLPNE